MRNNGDATSVADWRRILTYFLVERWELCLSLFQHPAAPSSTFESTAKYHTCGALMNREEYAGNMWWSVAHWITRLKGVSHVKWNMNHKYEAEDFLFRSSTLSKLNRRSFCLFNINHNMYNCETPRSLYTGNNSVPYPLRTKPECYHPPNVIRSPDTRCLRLRLKEENVNTSKPLII